MLFEKVDSIALNACEKFSHKTQRTIGIDCFDIALIFLNIKTIVVMLQFGYLLEHNHTRPGAITYILFGITLSLIFFVAWRWTINKTRKAVGISKITLNILRIHPLVSIFRVATLLSLPMELVFITYRYDSNTSLYDYPLSFTKDILFTGMIYFLSCTPLPPSESKMKKWLNSIKTALKSKTASAPA